MPRILAESITDFTGGLNLSPDTFTHSLNETPDCLNVDISRRGGFELRGAFVNWKDSGGLFFNTINTTWHYVNAAGDSRVMVCLNAAGEIYYHNGTSLVAVPAATAVQFGAGAHARAVVFKNLCYMVGGDVDPWRWDGVTANNAFQFSAFAFNDNLENPTLPPANGKFPRASLACSWMGSVWVADTWESAGRFPNRVRWSHPNFPEDWHSNHFIDIDPGKDHDGITALVPLDDRLLVFKRSSIHVIYGSPPESLQTRPLTYDVGCLHQDAVVATDHGVYFYDPIEGVYLIENNGLKWCWEKIFPAMQDGRISFTTSELVMLGWGNRRLWVSLPFDGSAVRSDVFILDPTLASKRSDPGSWTRYNLEKAPRQLGPFVEVAPPGANYDFLVAVSGDGDCELVAADQTSVSEDAFQTFPDSGDPTDLHIYSHFQTPWVDLGVSVAEKRWKRPQIVVKAGVEAKFFVDGFLNYDRASVRRSFALSTKGFAGFLEWGTGGAQNKWGTNLWAPSGDELNQIEHGSPLGTARSVALRFRGPMENVDWGVNEVTFRYIPRKIRNR